MSSTPEPDQLPPEPQDIQGRATQAATPPQAQPDVTTSPAANATPDAPTEHTTAHSAPPDPGAPPGPDWTDAAKSRWAALRRPREGRVLAGVAAAVSRELGIDPLLLRVVIVVLSFFGGAGVLLYALGWLFIADEATGRSAFDNAVKPSGPKTAALLLAIGLGLVILGTAGSVLSGGFDGLFFLGLVVLGAAWLAQRGTPQGWSEHNGPTGPAGPPPPWTPHSPPASFSGSPASPEPSPTGTPYPAGTVYPNYPSAPSAWTAATPTALLSPDAPFMAPHPPAPRRPKSVLTALTMSAMVLTLGLLGVLDALDVVSVSAITYTAVALGVVGLGLVVGTWVGRSRLLIAVGIGIGLLLLPMTAISRIDSTSWNDTPVVITPTTVAEANALSRDHGSGQFTFDLTDVPLAGQEIRIDADADLGELTVIVPPEATVVVDATVSLGELNLFGAVASGVDVTRSVTDAGTPDAGRIVLALDLGAGELEVHREAA